MAAGGEAVGMSVRQSKDMFAFSLQTATTCLDRTMKAALTIMTTIPLGTVVHLTITITTSEVEIQEKECG